MVNDKKIIFPLIVLGVLVIVTYFSKDFFINDKDFENLLQIALTIMLIQGLSEPALKKIVEARLIRFVNLPVDGIYNKKTFLDFFGQWLEEIAVELDNMSMIIGISLAFSYIAEKILNNFWQKDWFLYPSVFFLLIAMSLIIIYCIIFLSALILPFINKIEQKK